MFDSTDIIARKQYELGKALYQNATTEISGATVDYRHTFINFTNVAVTYDGKEVRTLSDQSISPLRPLHELPIVTIFFKRDQL